MERIAQWQKMSGKQGKGWVAISNRVIRGAATEVTYKGSPEEGEEVRHIGIWDKSIPDRGKVTAKILGWIHNVCTVAQKYQDDSMAEGVNKWEKESWATSQKDRIVVSYSRFGTLRTWLYSVGNQKQLYRVSRKMQTLSYILGSL